MEHWLTKYTSKESMHILHNATFYTTTDPYISSSDMIVGTISIFTAYFGSKCISMLWNVLSLFVYFVSQCMPPFKAFPRA